MATVTINGIRMWYDEAGRSSDPPLLLLHGGFSSSKDFDANLRTLSDSFHVFLPERRGHGHTPDPPGPISLDLLAEDTVAFLEEVVAGPARVVGYSAGGMVALWTAVRRPDLIERLVLVSAAFAKDGMLFLPQVGAQLPPPLVAAYAEASPDGVDHLPTVVDKIARSANEDADLSPDALGRIASRAMVVSGDDDLVSLEHTVALYRALPRGELAVIPNASHLLLMEHPAAVITIVREFLTGEPVPTLMPIRRAMTTVP